MRTHGDDMIGGRGRWVAAALIGALVTVGLGLAGCTAAPSSAADDEANRPAKVEAVPGESVKKVTLTEQASRRLGIRTVTVGAAPPGVPPATSPPSASPGQQGSSPGVVPYGAVLYDPNGVTWVYTVPQPLTYVRAKVVVATVGGTGGTEAVLSAGPPVGTTVVSTGVIELYGAELGVGK
jgi:hypothetical protein